MPLYSIQWRFVYSTTKNDPTMSFDVNFCALPLRTVCIQWEIRNWKINFTTKAFSSSPQRGQTQFGWWTLWYFRGALRLLLLSMDWPDAVMHKIYVFISHDKSLLNWMNNKCENLHQIFIKSGKVVYCMSEIYRNYFTSSKCRIHHINTKISI